MNLEDLDSILEYLYKETAYRQLEMIHQHLKKVYKGDFYLNPLILLEKLEKDGYVISKMSETGNSPFRTYSISFEGILLYETAKGKYAGKPYHYKKHLEEKKRRAERIENWPKRNWLLVAAFTYLIGLLTPTIQRSIEQRTGPKSTQSNKPIQKVADTLKNRNPASF